MDLHSDSGLRPIWGWLAALLSGALLYFGTGLHPLWGLTWLAPLPVLMMAPRLQFQRTFAAAFLAWLVGGLNLWTYLHRTAEVPLPVVVLALVGPALVFGCAVCLFRGFVCRRRIAAAALAVPVSWVAFEFANTLLSPHGTFLNIAYSQMDLLPVIQIASLTGIWGISFLLLLLPATIAALWNVRDGRRHLAGTVTLVFVAVFAFGIVRLRATPRRGSAITAALVATDVSQNVFPQAPEQALRLFLKYAAQSQPLQTAQAIVLPEKIAPVPASVVESIDSTFERTTAQTASYVVVGILRQQTPGARSFNEARVYSAGALQASYDKHHLIPGLEGDEQPGHTLTILSQPSGLWGIEICKDMDFPGLSRRYGRAGVGLVLAPAWDFVSDGWLHDRMAVLRGVESGFSLVRSAKMGRLTISDDRGRILAETISSAAPFTVLTASVPVRHDPTLYTSWGDWFAWLDLVALAVLLILLSRSSIKSPDASKQRTS